jgi:hypothetical protein
MMRPNIANSIALGILMGMSWCTPSWSAQQTASAPATVPVSVVVTVEARRGKEIPEVTREDVRVLQGQDRLEVTGWVPLRLEQSKLELFVLIDEAANLNVAMQFDDIRSFLNAQPDTTAVAVGYMENGTVRIVQNFTTNHSDAGKTLRIPLGYPGAFSSPYLSIADAIKHWPQSTARRAIFAVSDGVDPLQPGISDTYLDTAIAQAQRTGTQVYSIYASGAGHFGHSLWRINQGQSNLSRLADESGAEAYFQGLDTPIAFAPFLDQFAERLLHQYKLTFLAKAEKKASYQHVRLETEVPNAELVTADKVYVPAVK